MESVSQKCTLKQFDELDSNFVRLFLEPNHESSSIFRLFRPFVSEWQPFPGVLISQTLILTREWFYRLCASVRTLYVLDIYILRGLQCILGIQ